MANGAGYIFLLVIEAKLLEATNIGNTCTDLQKKKSK